MTATGNNIENTETILNLFYLPVYLVDRQLYLSVAVTSDKCCMFGQIYGRGGKLIDIFGKFAVVSCGIWRNLPR